MYLMGSPSRRGHASEEPEAIPIVPSNSPVYNDEQVNGALPRPHVQPIRYIKTVNDNDYVYRPEDRVFNRHRGETPVLTQNFATAGAQQKQVFSAKGPVNVDTPANKTISTLSSVSVPTSTLTIMALLLVLMVATSTRDVAT
jgi:hypothetical protein